MLRTLLESQATQTRGAGGTLISVGVHTAAIALAIAATARATTAPRDPLPATTKVTYVTPPQPNDNPRHTLTEHTCNCSRVVPVFHRVDWPRIVPWDVPPIDYSRSPIDEQIFDGAHISLAGAPPGGGELGRPTDGIYTTNLVEKAVVARPGNPAPVYPTSLRAAQVEGSVVARFVVDTAGRVEPASIAFPEATHGLFADAVRQSLLRSRYLPAIVGDHAVRQLVEQRFAFTLTR